MDSIKNSKDFVTAVYAEHVNLYLYERYWGHFKKYSDTTVFKLGMEDNPFPIYVARLPNAYGDYSKILVEEEKIVQYDTRYSRFAIWLREDDEIFAKRAIAEKIDSYFSENFKDILKSIDCLKLEIDKSAIALGFIKHKPIKNLEDHFEIAIEKVLFN